MSDKDASCIPKLFIHSRKAGISNRRVPKIRNPKTKFGSKIKRLIEITLTYTVISIYNTTGICTPFISILYRFNFEVGGLQMHEV